MGTSRFFRFVRSPWQRFFYLFGAGALLNFAGPPYFLFPLLIPLFFIPAFFMDQMIHVHHIKGALTGQRSRKSLFKKGALIGFAFGFGYFFAGLYWIGSSFLVEPDKFLWVLPFAVTLLPFGLSLFWALAFGISACLWQQSFLRVIYLAVLLFLAEWLRGTIFTGFPWNLPAYFFAGDDRLIQLIYPLGTYGVSFLVLLWVLLPTASQYGGRFYKSKIKFIAPLAASFLILVGGYVYGGVVLNNAPQVTKTFQNLPYQIVLIQPNIDQKIRVDPNKRPEVIDAHISLSKTVQPNPNDHRPLLFIWGENAAPYAINKDEHLRSHLMKVLPTGSHLIVGGYDVQDKLKPTRSKQTVDVYNALFLLGPDGQILGRYHKKHLVPFGEYFPFGNWLMKKGISIISALPGGFAKGRDIEVGVIKLQTGQGILPMICYEAIFPISLLQRKALQQKTDVILNLTNDGWFGNTAGPQQHFHMVRIRAIELRRPLIRVSNSGVSAFIDPFGRIIKQTEFAQRKVLSIGLQTSH